MEKETTPLTKPPPFFPQRTPEVSVVAPIEGPPSMTPSPI